MKKIGIITLTRQNSLAYSVLKRIVENLGYTPICGEAIGADSLFFPLEELTLIGYDFLGDFFKKAEISDADILLISAPYSVNLFFLPKLIWCLRSISSAPIILGGNEASNNYKNLMLYRFSTFANQVIDISPDFIVRGPAERVLFSLLPLLDKTTMTRKWDKDLLKQLLEIPNIVFWLPDKRALFSTEFSSENLTDKDIFTFVKYGEKSIAVTLQRACIWAKKSKGGCLF
ncbi:MAG: cobalamin B12-binding domain-containing protein, partial [Desulfobacterales bacterium]|nr:cobalamin B12-binding domain-containing protein [Desulfobacterales bacterium]